MLSAANAMASLFAIATSAVTAPSSLRSLFPAFPPPSNRRSFGDLPAFKSRKTRCSGYPALFTTQTAKNNRRRVFTALGQFLGIAARKVNDELTGLIGVDKVFS